MDSLQYSYWFDIHESKQLSFKPCYKWIAFNTVELEKSYRLKELSFKPCYKWIAFNTNYIYVSDLTKDLSFKPCYKWIAFNTLDLNKNIDFMAF